MVRAVYVTLIVVAGLCFAGCKACYSPYEKCPPTFVPERGDRCMGELYRSGSILGGMQRTESANAGCKTCQSGIPQTSAVVVEPGSNTIQPSTGAPGPGNVPASGTPGQTGQPALGPFGQDAPLAPGDFTVGDSAGEFTLRDDSGTDSFSGNVMREMLPVSRETVVETPQN